MKLASDLRSALYFELAILKKAAAENKESVDLITGLLEGDATESQKTCTQLKNLFQQGKANNYNRYLYALLCFYQCIDTKNLDEVHQIIMRESAENRRATASYILGIMYRDGTVPKQHPFDVERCFTSAGTQGYPPAMYQMALLREKKFGTVTDEVCKTLESAASANHRESQLKLVALYEQGTKVKKNLKRVRELSEMLANNGLYGYAFKAATMYEKGEGGNKDLKKAGEYYQLAAMHGNVQAALKLAWIYEHDASQSPGHLASAFHYYKQAADKGDVLAIGKVAEFYLGGKGVDKQPAAALPYLDILVKKDNPEAKYFLGKMYEKGEGVPKDIKRAAELYESAANQGYAPAQFLIGLMYAFGGEAPTPEMIEQDGMNVLATLMSGSPATASGFPCDLVKGKKYLKMAVEGGFAYGQAILSLLEVRENVLGRVTVEKLRQQGELYKEFSKPGKTQAGPVSDGKAPPAKTATVVETKIDRERKIAFDNDLRYALNYELSILKKAAPANKELIDLITGLLREDTTESQKICVQLKDLVEQRKADGFRQYLYALLCFYSCINPLNWHEVHQIIIKQAKTEKRVSANYLLGMMHTNGLGVDKNSEQADLCFALGLQDYAPAIYQVALRREQEKSGETYELLERAAKLDHTRSQLKLLVFYEKGRAVTQDVKWMRELFEMLARKGFASAFHASQRGTQTKTKEGSGKIFEALGDQLYEVFTKNGPSNGYYESRAECGAWNMMELMEIENAGKYYQQAAKQGIRRAILNFAWLHEHDVSQSPEVFKYAFQYYKQAADQGDLSAIVKVADWYKQGKGVGKDPTEAARYLEMANKLQIPKKIDPVAKEPTPKVPAPQDSAPKDLAAKDPAPAKVLFSKKPEKRKSLVPRKIQAQPAVQAQPALVATVPATPIKPVATVAAPFPGVVITPSAAVETKVVQERTDQDRVAQEQKAELEFVGQSLKNGQQQETVNFIINYKDLKIGKEIAAGGFGTVYLGTWTTPTKPDVTHVAIKKLKNQKHSDTIKKEFKKECNIMSRFEHPNVVKLWGFCVSPKCLVMEYMSKGDLYAVIKKEKQYLPETRVKIMRDVLNGLAFLHSKDVIHRDLKSKNILLNETVAKVSDFGLSKVKFDDQSSSSVQHTGMIGTYGWMAPEVVTGKLTKASDIFSMGMVIWELCAWKKPHLKLEAEGVPAAFIPIRANEGYREEISKDWSPKLQEMIGLCWAKNPEERPDAISLLNFAQSTETSFKEFLPKFRAKSSTATSTQVLPQTTVTNGPGGAQTPAQAVQPKVERKKAGV